MGFNSAFKGLREEHRAYRLKIFLGSGLGGGCLDLRGVKN
jgi:hypothetical protein